MTNEPNGNFVVAAQLNTDGSIVSRCTPEMIGAWADLPHLQRFDRAVATRGLGSHGVTDPNGPDGTFSQGTVKANAESKTLAVVNVSFDAPFLSNEREQGETDERLML